MAHKETLLTWLNNAHSMEQALIEVLESHAKQAEDHPDVKARIEQHREETEKHADLVSARIKALGGDVSAVKTGMGDMMGTFKGMGTAMADDRLIKNSIMDYAAEHFEIASYTAIMTAAEAMGDEDTVTMCETILSDEEDMAQWLEEQLPSLVEHYTNTKVAEHES